MSYLSEQLPAYRLSAAYRVCFSSVFARSFVCNWVAFSQRNSHRKSLGEGDF